MQGNRTLATRKKSRIIVDKSFPVYSQLNVGDSGQAIIQGIIDGERLDMIDDIEQSIKTIRIKNMELINNKQQRA